jgi:hypothetical protein
VQQTQPGQLVPDLGDDGAAVTVPVDLHPRMVAAPGQTETGRWGDNDRSGCATRS